MGAHPLDHVGIVGLGWVAGAHIETFKSVKGATVTADDAYLRESIVQPSAKIVEGYQPIMPTFQGIVTEEQIVQLIAYVQSLKGGAPAGAAEQR